MCTAVPYALKFPHYIISPTSSTQASVQVRPIIIPSTLQLQSVRCALEEKKGKTIQPVFLFYSYYDYITTSQLLRFVVHQKK